MSHKFGNVSGYTGEHQFMNEVQKLNTFEQLFAERQTYEPQCGLYFLFREDELVYVGQSIDLYSRLAAHHKSDKQWDSYTFLPRDREQLDDLETEYIVHFNPEYNTTIPSTNKWVTLSMVALAAKRKGINKPIVNRYVREQNLADVNGYYLVSDFTPLGIFED